jgi:hypothetical protein
MVTVMRLPWLLLALTLFACRGKESDSEPSPVVSATPSAAVSVPLDRLAPGELAPGKSQVFGFDIPKEMEIKSRGIDRVVLEGEVDANAVVTYVRDRVIVSHVELGAGRTIFPQARIRQGAPDRVYQLEVVPIRRLTQLVIEDVTPKPDPGNLSQEERWKRAGRGPDGKPIRDDLLK